MTESLTWRLRYLFNATIVLQIPSVIFLYYIIIRKIYVSDLHMKCECLWACLWFLGLFFVRICSSKETVVPRIILKA